MVFVFTWSCQFPCSALYVSWFRPGFIWEKCPPWPSVEISPLCPQSTMWIPHSWGGKLGWIWGFGGNCTDGQSATPIYNFLGHGRPLFTLYLPQKYSFFLQYWNCIKTGSKSLAPSIPAHVGLILIWSQAESDQLTPGSDQQDPSNLIRSLSRSWRAPRAHALQLFWLHPQL